MGLGLTSRPGGLRQDALWVRFGAYQGGSNLAIINHETGQLVPAVQPDGQP